MPSFKAPTGDTSTSRIKSLSLWVDHVRGQVEGDDFLQDAGVPRDLLQDETRPVSVAVHRRALDAFVRRYGFEALEQTRAEISHRENLGPWIHVMRAAESVSDAYRLLDSGSTQLRATTRFETLAVTAHRWRGRLHVLHDASLERDGLLSRARRLELEAVPTLFGGAPAEVIEVLSVERGDAFYEYEARWRDPGISRVTALSVIAVGGLVFGVTGYLAFGRAGALVLALVGVVAGAMAAHLLREGQVRRAQVHAQSMRIRALERNLELSEATERPSVFGDLGGQVIAGLYELGARLGAGATGVIYQAERLSDRAPVAIKLLRTAVAQDSVAADRLSREAESLRLAWHPNVVELYDQGTLPDGTAYLVMELLEGESLAARLQRERRIDERALIPIIDQICDALNAVHAAGVIHRDLKPSNIYLCEPSGLRASQAWSPKYPTAPRVKVFDFGIARVEWAETRITQAGAPLGTPGYMSPEQENGEAVDLRADIYALGATVFECLTGSSPPLRPRNYDVSALSHWEMAASSAGLPPQLPEAIKPVVERAMAPRASDRYPDARSFLHALVSAVESSSETTGSGTIAKAKRAQ